MQVQQIQYSRPIISRLFKGVKHDEVKWTINYLLTLLESPEITETKPEPAETVTTREHTAWVQSMAKYRRLQPMDDKKAMLEALDERYHVTKRISSLLQFQFIHHMNS